MALLLEQEIEMELTTVRKHSNYSLMNCFIAEWQLFGPFSKCDNSTD